MQRIFNISTTLRKNGTSDVLISFTISSRWQIH